MFAISNIHIVHVSVNIPQMQMFCCKSFLERFEDVHIYFIVARLKIEPLRANFFYHRVGGGT